MKTVLLSYWRNDADRNIIERVRHLQSKQDVWYWVWVVGDSSDETEQILRALAGPRTGVLRANTGIVGEDIDTRRLRISATETLAYAHLMHYPEADYVVQHESDLKSSTDVIKRLIQSLPDQSSVIAGWPTLTLEHDTVFYDIWAYRGLDGGHFSGSAPYHHDYRADEVFEVESVGSVWLAPARVWRNMMIDKDCCVELCQKWRADGLRVFVDPRIEIKQPRELWVLS